VGLQRLRRVLRSGDRSGPGEQQGVGGGAPALCGGGGAGDVQRVAGLPARAARRCDDVDARDSYLPPHVAALARKVADVLEVPQPGTA
jgi:hypothetical protein